MNKKQRQRLYVRDMLDDPSLPYPVYYTLSSSMIKNEMLLSTIEALHSYNLDYYETPKSYDDIFAMFDGGSFAIYKERYIVGYFGGKMMYLEPIGWKSMPATKELFEPGNWLVC